MDFLHYLRICAVILYLFIVHKSHTKTKIYPNSAWLKPDIAQITLDKATFAKNECITHLKIFMSSCKVRMNGLVVSATDSIGAFNVFI